MRIYASLLFILLALTSLLRAQNLPQPSTHDLVFENLAPSWDEGIPLGNGMMGALVWEKDGRIRIALDRADLWDLRPTENIYQEGINFKWVHKNWQENTYNKVQKALDEYYDKAAGPSKIPVAALEMSLDHLGPVESVRLYTHHGLCRIQWKNGSFMEIFMDPEKPVGWFRLEGVDAAQEIKLVAPPYAHESLSSERNKVIGGQDVERLGYPAGQLDNGMASLDYRQEGWNGFHYQVHCKLDRRVGSITGCWSISAHYPDQEAAPSAKDYLNQSGRSSYEESRQEMFAWWDQYWSRSAVSLPDPVLEKQWYLEMYKFGAAARKGAPPISLQAVWTADNGLLPPWKGDFHHDLNTQLSYWPAYAGNQLDLEKGFLDWLWGIREEGLKYTRWFFECDGLNIPGVSTLRGVPMGGWSQYSYSPTVSAWLGHHFYLHWKYSQDEKFLRERAYPWMKEVAIFLDQLAEKDPHGRRKLPLSSSPEIFDNRPEAWFEESTNYDLSLIRFAYKAASEMATELGLQEEAKNWESILSEWPDMAVDPESGLMFAPGFPYLESHRHFSHLMAFHPLGMMDVSQGPAQQEVISNTLRNMEKHGPDYWTGYSYSWMANLYARAFEGENAARALKDFATCFTLPSSFHVNGDQSGTGKSKFTYRPFTLEGNFAFASGIHEMLLQSHTGIVHVFPAVPASWKNISFRTLRTEGAFLVSATREEGACTRVEITAEKGGTLRLADPFAVGPDPEILEFQMEQGESLLLEQETPSPNIILFYVDDMGWQDCSVPFHSEETRLNRIYHTPNMELLAKEGMKFTQAYACAVCSPSRISLMTGMNGARHQVTNWTLRMNQSPDPEHKNITPPSWNMNGMTQGEEIPLTTQAISLPQLLKESGYRTIHAGKAHFGAVGTPGENPLNLGFEVNIAGHAAGGPGSYLGRYNYSADWRDGDRIWDVPGLEKYHGKEVFLTEALTREASAEIERALEDKKPFYLYLAHYAIHAPWEIDDRFFENYAKEGISDFEAVYASMIEGMDKSLGDIMNLLKEKGQWENTILIFMSDNGQPSQATLNKPLRGHKLLPYEGGIRVPLIVYWPEHARAGSVNSQYVMVEDLFPTILEMAGLSYGEKLRQVVDGRSFVPYLENETLRDNERPLFWHFPHTYDQFPYSAVRQGDWKLIYRHLDQSLELYNLKKDLSETTNLASKETGIRKELASLLSDYLREVEAGMPVLTKNNRPVPYPDEIK